jgi:hypothetical protein
VNIFDDSAVSRSSQTAEQSDSTPITDEGVGPLLGELFQASAKPLFPQLSQAFGSLFDAIQPGQQSPSQTISSPFSPAAAGVPSGLLNNPSQLLDLLGNASQKLSNGLAASAGVQDQPAAQQALLKMQAAVAQASLLIDTRGQKQSGHR